jgi:hypothetical protein
MFVVVDDDPYVVPTPGVLNTIVPWLVAVVPGVKLLTPM